MRRHDDGGHAAEHVRGAPGGRARVSAGRGASRGPLPEHERGRRRRRPRRTMNGAMAIESESTPATAMSTTLESSVMSRPRGPGESTACTSSSQMKTSASGSCSAAKPAIGWPVERRRGT